jgi:hypothetical protein
MFISSWINFKEKVEKSKNKIFIEFIIIAFLMSLTIFFKENYIKDIVQKILPFIYATIFMFTISGALNLYEKEFRIKKIFLINVSQIFKFLFGFLIWSIAVYLSFLIAGKNDNFFLMVLSIIYLILITVKFIVMFFYIVDKNKQYNPIKAMVRSFTESKGKNIKILFLLIINLIIIFPIYISKEILGDTIIIEIGNRDRYSIIKSITMGSVDAIIFIYISIHLSYVYKTISERQK